MSAVAAKKRGSARPANPPELAVCIGCGCDDLHACEDGIGEPCSWMEIDRVIGIGICSGHAITDQMRHAFKQLRVHLRRYQP